jgi:hypothetical protein
MNQRSSAHVPADLVDDATDTATTAGVPRRICRAHRASPQISPDHRRGNGKP